MNRKKLAKALGKTADSSEAVGLVLSAIRSVIAWNMLLGNLKKPKRGFEYRIVLRKKKKESIQRKKKKKNAVDLPVARKKKQVRTGARIESRV